MQYDFSNLPAHMVETFMNYPDSIRPHLLNLRNLILHTAQQNSQIGPIEETLKWQEASYLTPVSKSGSTLRIGAYKAHPNKYAIYVNCKTELIAIISTKYPSLLEYCGRRAIIMDINSDYPQQILTDIIQIILTYHLRNKSR